MEVPNYTMAEEETPSKRAKRMLMGEIDLGQFRFKNTDTMLPRKHQQHMSAILQLFGLGIIVVDVFAGGDRAAIGFLAPLSSQSRWVPGDDYIVQTAVQRDLFQCEVVARQDIRGQSKWKLGEKREHNIDEFPRKHLARVNRIAVDAWKTMVLVFIWEREPRDDIGALAAWIHTL